MNAQSLKDNRNEIISRINEIADTDKLAEIMKAMLNIVEGGMNESDNPIDLVDEVVILMGYERKINVRDAYEINQENIRKNLPSSLR